MTTFNDLKQHVHVYNTGRAPQFFGKVIVPARAYSTLPETLAYEMQKAGVPIIAEYDETFTPLFKRCDGTGQVD